MSEKHTRNKHRDKLLKAYWDNEPVNVHHYTSADTIAVSRKPMRIMGLTATHLTLQGAATAEPSIISLAHVCFVGYADEEQPTYNEPDNTSDNEPDNTSDNHVAFIKAMNGEADVEFLKEMQQAELKEKLDLLAQAFTHNLLVTITYETASNTLADHHGWCHSVGELTGDNVATVTIKTGDKQYHICPIADIRQLTIHDEQLKERQWFAEEVSSYAHERTTKYRQGIRSVAKTLMTQRSQEEMLDLLCWLIHDDANIVNQRIEEEL